MARGRGALGGVRQSSDATETHRERQQKTDEPHVVTYSGYRRPRCAVYTRREKNVYHRGLRGKYKEALSFKNKMPFSSYGLCALCGEDQRQPRT